MKNSPTIFIPLLLLFFSVSCIREDILPEYEDPITKSVYLSVTQQSTSKSVDTPTAENQHTVIHSAVIYFLDKNDDLLLQRELTDNEVAIIQNTSTTSSNKELEISGIPSRSTHLIFVANCATTATPDFAAINTTTTRSTYRLDSLQSGGVDNVPLFDRSGAFVEVDATRSRVSVLLEPVVARLEIKKVSFRQNTPLQALDITSFKLGGIYLNNIRPRVMINGMAYSDKPVDARDFPLWDSGRWDEVFGVTSFPYLSSVPSGWIEGALQSDCLPNESALTFYPSLTSGATALKPAESLVWGYNLTPSINTIIGVVSADIPHLILRLTDVQYVNNPGGSTQLYVVVGGYRDMQGDIIEGFLAGRVYSIEDLVFEYNDATIIPYQEDVSVVAKVTVTPWEVSAVKPGLD